MAAKKKTKKKQTKSKRIASNKARPTTKRLTTRATLKKKPAKKTPRKKATVKTKAVGKKAIDAKTVSALKKRVRAKSQSVNTVAFSRERSGARSGGQSGDLQGLSDVERADSESVDELIEEGNAFEADVVTGVENAGNTDAKEVRTHEVPEDDIPDEYLEKD